ncbi:MAG: hypothetical protein KDA89_00435 [Planctomycetaceae bacterium]|nr:hypothetical protein [Planctomycetaceae bacterium]MCA9047161.1 hypothetical protein [Planctomycetaceae bacterium]
MKNTLGTFTAFGITLLMTAATSAQDYVCPFGRDRSHSVANREWAGQYPDQYSPSECPDGMCPYEARRYQQQLTSHERGDGALFGSTYDSRIPTRSQLNYDQSHTYNLRSDFGRSSIDDRDRSYDRRYDDYRQPSTYQQSRQFDRPSTYDRSLSNNRGFPSVPPPSFNRSPLNSRGPVDDFQQHQHDGNCNHGDRPASSPRQSYDPGPSGNPAPRYNPTPREQFSTPQQPRSNQPITEGPPSL